MATVYQQPVPAMIKPYFEMEGIRIKRYRSAAGFEKDLKRFLKCNHVLHLGTTDAAQPRVTPLEYRLVGLSFYILSEGGGKFKNLKQNRRVCFSIAEPYNSEEDFFGSRGLQAWGTANVYSRKETPKKFREALEKINIKKILKRFGMEDVPKEFHYRIIEITPVRIKYSNPREGVYHVTWKR